MSNRTMSPTATAALVALVSIFCSPCSRLVSATTGVTRGTIVIERGVDSGKLTATLDATEFADDQQADECTFDGGIVSLSHPMSLKAGDKFFSTGQLQHDAISMMIDEVNTSPRCGIEVGGKKYGLKLTTYGDDSSKAKVAAIVENGMVPAIGGDDAAANFWLGPYSSGLTGAMSTYANSTNTILVAGGAASTSVFKGYPTIFGTFPPTAFYLAQAIEALAGAGAKTVASLWEEASFTRGVCAALPTLAEQHDLVLQSQTEVPSSPTGEHLDPIASNFSSPANDPDVVVTCVYDQGCAEWIASLRRSGWTPRGQVFTVCIGMDQFVENVGTDAMYMMGISPWDASLAMADDVVGWSAAEFAERFVATTARTPTYHSASAAASVGVLIQAIERANSFDSDAVASVLSTEEFTTLYGRLSFNENGQSKAPSLFLQYDQNITVQTVYPLETRSGDLVYPMPTWEHRDCSLLSTCETGSEFTSSGQCQEDGTCLCDSEDAISSGIGPNATCVVIPNEDMTYIDSALKVLGIVFFAIQAVLSVACAAWTIYFRRRRVVKSSQPLFLCLICFGTLVMSLAIIPIGIQTQYREVQDPFTGELTGEASPDIGRADAACMAVPWLFSLGFSIVFSALFAKIWRIKLVHDAARSFVKKTVEVKDVVVIMVAVLAVQIVIMLCWHIIDPMIWQREVLFEDANGFPTKSLGSCRSESVLRFLIPLIVTDVLMLFYALFLCFIARDVSSEYQEGTWVTASVLSIIQILVLSIPVLVIVDNDTNAYYFVRVAVVFLMSFTVTSLIFFPKMYRFHFNNDPTTGLTLRRGSFSRSAMADNRSNASENDGHRWTSRRASNESRVSRTSEVSGSADVERGVDSERAKRRVSFG